MLLPAELISMALPTLLTTNALKMRRRMFTALVVLRAQEQQELQ
jgi:hypothetical protein